MAKSELSKLVAKLDRIFSEYIRRKNADPRGMVRCCTCNKIDHFKKMDCGHFMSRRYMSTRYEEQNVGVQCQACNRFNQGRQFEMSQYLDRTWGPGTAEKMSQNSKWTTKRNRYDYLVLIDHFKTKLNKL